MSVVEAGWVPIRIFRDGERWSVDWCRLGAERFTDPFFEQTVRRCLNRPFNLAFRRITSLDDLPESNPHAVAPAGFLFLLSRSGSTLVSQTFAASADTLVLSEAGPIDEVLRGSRHEPGVSDEARVRRLRALIAAYGAALRGTRHLVVKCDAWHVFDLAIFERAFPGVPWFFLYRDPVEIMVSHARSQSWFMSAVNAPTLLGLSAAEAMRVPVAEYHARVLARLCDAVLTYGVTPERLIGYEELPEAIDARIAPAFGISLGSENRAAAARDAKHPERAFVPDAHEKRTSADAPTLAAVERWLQAPYARLEAIRNRERTIAASRP